MMENSMYPEYPNQPQVQLPYVQPSKWVKFAGVVQIIFGILSTLTIIGAGNGIPMIFAGRRLIKGFENAKNYSTSGDPNQLAEMIGHYHRFFHIFGILNLISIICMVLYFLGIIALIIFGVYSGFQEWERDFPPSVF